MQEGDVKLFQTNDDGEISVVNGVTEMSGGLETAAYLSMFGGNEQDDGLNESATWWGNIGEQDPDFQYKSETQFLLKSIPATTGNLLRIEEAARRDLEWMLNKAVASSVEINIGIPALNRVYIGIAIQADGDEIEFAFTANWKVEA